MATLTYKIERSAWRSGIQRLVVVVGIKLYDSGKVVPVPHMRVLLLNHQLGTGRVSGINFTTQGGRPPDLASVGLSGREIAMNRKVQGWRPSI